MLEELDPLINLHCFLAMALSVTIGLVALWAAVSRRHWFVRTSVVGGVLLLGTPLAAYDLILIYFVQCVVVVLGVRAAMALSRRRDRASALASPNDDSPDRRAHFRFSLTDALLATLVAAVAVAVGAKAPTDFREFWLPFSTVGFCFGAVMLAAAWLALGRRRLWIRLIVFCIIAWAVGLSFMKSTLIPTLPPEVGEWACVWTAAGGMSVTAWLLLARRRWRGVMPGDGGEPCGEPSRVSTDAARRRMGTVVWGLLTIVLVLPPAVTYLKILKPMAIPDAALPVPNGYDQLVRIGKVLENVAIPDTEQASTAALRSFVTKYQTELDQIRDALDHEIRVPVDYTAAMPSPFDAMSGHRQLARGLLAEAKLAADEGRDADARKGYRDVSRLGGAVSRGGMLIDYLVGIAIAGPAINGASTSIDGWDDLGIQAPDMRRYLQSLAPHMEPLKDIWHRERVWTENFSGWRGRLYVQLGMFEKYGMAETVQTIEYQGQARRRLLLCQWALRRYRVKHDRYPDRLDELVPKFLTEVPDDPYSTGPLTYRKTSEGKYQLYSLWRDGEDNQGSVDVGGFSGDLMLQRDPALDKVPPSGTK